MTTPAPVAAATRQKNTLGLVSLVLSVFAFLFAIVPVLSFIAWMPAIAAIALGIIGLVRKNRARSLAWTGLILGVFAWIVAIVVSVSTIADLGSRNADPAPSPTLTASISASDPATVDPEASTPAPESPTPNESATPSDTDRAAVFQQALSDAFGGASSAELLVQDPSSWAGYVNGVRVERSNAYVTLQVTSGDAGREDLGQRAARALSTLIPASAVEGINWIIVEDASGVVIDQKQPAPLS